MSVNHFKILKNVYIKELWWPSYHILYYLKFSNRMQNSYMLPGEHPLPCLVVSVGVWADRQAAFSFLYRGPHGQV